MQSMQQFSTSSPANGTGNEDLGRAGALWDRFVASDPGWNRLRMAGRAVAATGTALLVERLVADVLLQEPAQLTLIAMVLGAVTAMIGSMGLGSGSTKDRLISAGVFPVALGTGLTVGTATSSNTDLLLSVFVVVLFVAVYVRRFGPRFFFAGFMAWIGYFLSSFLGAGFGQLPAMLLFTVVSLAWVLALSLTVMRDNPRRVLQQTIRALTARASSVADAAADVLAGEQRAGRRLERRLRRLNETALMVEGYLAEDGAVPEGWSAARLRQALTDAELSFDEVALAAEALGGLGPPRSPALGQCADMLRALAGRRTAAAREAAASLATGIVPALSDAGGHATRHLATAVSGVVDALDRLTSPPAAAENGAGRAEFTPSVTMMMGRLPGSAAVASDVRPRSFGWNPLARLPMTTRQAVQVAIAGGLAIAVGRELSSQRYYWAVIAAFVAFTGTATRGETFTKSMNRVLGTAVGLVVAILMAQLTAGHTAAVLAVVLASLFFGFYLQQLSYGFMIFFITIMVGQLYSALGVFSDYLLVLRLEETAVGAAIGVLVALFVLPVSTTDTSRVARTAFYDAVRELFDGLATRLAGSAVASDEDAADLDGLARAVDAALYQLRTVLQPLTGLPALRSDARRIRRRLTLYGATSSAARAVASASRDAAAVPDADLSAAARELAEAAGTLAQRSDPDEWAQGAAPYLRSAQDHLNRAQDRDPYAVHPLSKPIGRGLQVLRRLADGSHHLPSAAPDTAEGTSGDRLALGAER